MRNDLVFLRICTRCAISIVYYACLNAIHACNFEEEVESESINSSSGPESDINEGELGEYDDESNAPQAASGVAPEVAAAAALAYRHEPEQELDAEHLQII